MNTKLIKGVMMNCTKCHHVNAYEQTITDKTCPECGGTTEQIGTCTMVVRDDKDEATNLIEKQWEMFIEVNKAQARYITDKIMDMTKAAVTNTNKDDSVHELAKTTGK